MLLAAAKGRPISREDFCQQFQHLFIIPGQYGALIPSQIVDVVRPLGLGTYFQTYRRYEEIVDVFTNQKRSVLVSSEINLNAGATDVIRHFSLLTCIDSTRFSIITPTQNAGDIPKDFVVADWDINDVSWHLFVMSDHPTTSPYVLVAEECDLTLKFRFGEARKSTGC